MKRRRVLAAFGGTLLLGGAGAFYLADGLTDLAASPAGVDPDVRAATGYEETGVEELVVEEPLPGGVGDVVVTNYATEHEKAVDLEPLGRRRAALFVTLSTPQVRIAGREFNPVEEMSTDELVALVQDSYGGLENVARDEDGAVTVLGQPTRYARYTADATFDGVAVPVDLYVTEAVETATDLVIAVAAYPRDLRAFEEDDTFDLLAGIVAERPGSNDGADGEGSADAEPDRDADGDGSEDDGIDGLLPGDDSGGGLLE